jgi:hypothetical protein
MQTLTAKPKDYRILSIDDFLNLPEEDRASIRRIKILAPNMDDDEFGYMQVFYDLPIYEVEIDDDCDEEE